jgi:uncharacterized membrane protein (UPF0127 family)
MTIMTMKRARIHRTMLLLLPLLALLMGCEHPPATTQGNLPIVSIKIGSKSYNLEVAADEYSRMRGLMERDSMPADHGMIFVFDDEQERGFWMHNTRIPLDILFLDSSGNVVSIHTMKPYDENTTYSDKKAAKYAIELNAGAVGDNGAKIGDKLLIPATTQPADGK